MVLAFQIYIIIGELIALACLCVPGAGDIFEALDEHPVDMHWPLAVVAMIVLVLIWPFLILRTIWLYCK